MLFGILAFILGFNFKEKYYKSSGTVDVTWYGADKYGIIDCNGAFTKALEAINDGGTLLIPPGEYIFKSQGVEINKKNITVIADGAKLILNKNIKYGLKIISDGCTVIGLEVDGRCPAGKMIGNELKEVPQSNIDTYGIHVDASSITLKKCYAHHSIFPILVGATNKSLSNIKILDCLCEYSGQNKKNANINGDLALGSNIAIKGTGSSAVIENVIVSNCITKYGAYSGVELEPNVRNSTINNIISSHNMHNGVLLLSCEDISISGLSSNNVGDGVSIIGSKNIRVEISSFSNFRGCSVQNNHSESNGIVIRGEYSKNKNSGIAIEKTTSEFNCSNIFVDANLENNSLESPKKYSGIYISKYPDNIVVKGRSTGETQRYGVEVNGVVNLSMEKIDLVSNGVDSFSVLNYKRVILNNLIDKDILIDYKILS